MTLRRYLLACALATLAACGGTPSPGSPTFVSAPAGNDLMFVANEIGTFETLLAALDAAELTATLQGDGPFTLFAPTDGAFAALPDGTLDELLADPPRLRAVLTYHVVDASLSSSALRARSAATTLQGGSLSLAEDDDGLRVNDARVMQADVAASNGTLHVIDAVLLPPS